MSLWFKHSVITLFLLNTVVDAYARDEQLSSGLALDIFNYSSQSNESFGVYMLSASVGYRVLPYLAVDARAGVSVGESLKTENVGGDMVKRWVEVSPTLSTYLKPVYPLGKYAFYSLFGYAYNKVSQYRSVEIAGHIDEARDSQDLAGLSYGVGGSYHISKSSILEFEWRQLVKQRNQQISGISVGFRHLY